LSSLLSSLGERTRLVSHRPELLLAIADSIVLSYLSALRYWSYTDAWDLGGFVQSIWSASHGGLLDNTVNSFFYLGFPGQLVHTFLGTHFSPFLFLLVPPYALVPSPVTLLVIQSVVVATGVLPIYWLAKTSLTKRAALGLSFAYVMYPPIVGLSLDNFHPEAFVPTLMMFAIYFAVEEKWLGAAVSSALVMSTIEQGGYLVAALGAFLFVYHRAWRRRPLLAGLILMIAVPVGYSIIATYVRTDFGFNPNGFTVTLNSGNFQQLGVNFSEQIPAGVISNPIRALGALAYDLPGKLEWLISVLAPVAFIPVIAPEALLLAVPYLPVALLSNYPGYYSAYGIEQAFLIGATFPATVLGLRRMRRNGINTDRVVAIILVSSLVFATVLDFPPGIYGNSFSVGPTAQIESRFVSLIPSNASVLTTSDIFPHLGNRIDAYVVPPSTLRSGYSSIDSAILASILPPDYVMLNLGSPSGNVIAEGDALLRYVTNHSSYGVLAYDDKVALFELGYTGPPEVMSFPTVFNSTNLEFSAPTQSLGSQLVYPSGSATKTMWFGPYTFLPEGNYSATFNLRLTPAPLPNLAVLRIDVVWNASDSVLAERTLYSTDFTNGSGVFTLNFTVSRPIVDLEFRGINPSNATTITLEGISVTST